MPDRANGQVALWIRNTELNAVKRWASQPVPGQVWQKIKVEGVNVWETAAPADERLDQLADSVMALLGVK